LTVIKEGGGGEKGLTFTISSRCIFYNCHCYLSLV